MKNIINPLLLIITAASLFSSCANEIVQEEKKPPNILFIAVDDLRPELNCYGKKEIISPNIDQLASEGMLFTRSYCNVPTCGASRASLMTGMRLGRHRFLSFKTMVEEDAPNAIVLSQHFKNNGYTTISNGKVLHNMEDRKESWDDLWRLASNSSNRDYQQTHNIALDTGNSTRGYFFENANVHDTIYRDGKIANKTIRDLHRLKTSKKPFFLAVGFMKPHLPFNAPTKYWDMYDRNKIQLPDNNYRPKDAPDASVHNSGELRAYTGIPKKVPLNDSLAITMIHGYRACVSYVDAQIGRVLDALKETRLDKNTIVVLWGDHGWNLREHGLWCKHCNFNTSLHAPLITKVPGIEGGKKSDALVEFVDIYPTLCELAGIAPPENQLEGESYLSLLKDPNSNWNNQIIAKFRDGLTIKTDRYSYTEWSKSDTTTYARMLYDHQNDYAENTNISELPENKILVDSLSKLLFENRGQTFNNKPISKTNR